MKRLFLLFSFVVMCLSSEAKKINFYFKKKKPFNEVCGYKVIIVPHKYPYRLWKFDLHNCKQFKGGPLELTDYRGVPFYNVEGGYTASIKGEIGKTIKLHSKDTDAARELCNVLGGKTYHECINRPLDIYFAVYKAKSCNQCNNPIKKDLKPVSISKVKDFVGNVIITCSSKKCTVKT